MSARMVLGPGAPPDQAQVGFFLGPLQIMVLELVLVRCASVCRDPILAGMKALVVLRPAADHGDDDQVGNVVDLESSPEVGACFWRTAMGCLVLCLVLLMYTRAVNHAAIQACEPGTAVGEAAPSSHGPSASVMAADGAAEDEEAPLSGSDEEIGVRKCTMDRRPLIPYVLPPPMGLEALLHGLAVHKPVSIMEQDQVQREARPRKASLPNACRWLCQ
jgi:hypothetical protein